MSGHTIAWTIEPETISGRFTCHEADSTCRLFCTDPYCEFWSVPPRLDPDGVWRHSALDDDDNNIDHVCAVSGSCNYVDWMTADGNRSEDLYDGEPAALVDGPVMFTWEGDYYTWAYVPAPAERHDVDVDAEAVEA